MTDTSTKVTITIPHPDLSRSGFRRLALGASLNEICGLIGDAFRMAYVDPYTSLRPRPQIVPDDDLESRDPKW